MRDFIKSVTFRIEINIHRNHRGDVMRFYEFCDLDLAEDLATTLDTKKRQLDNQAKVIANRKKALSNQKAQTDNRETVRKMASRNLESE